MPRLPPLGTVLAGAVGLAFGSFTLFLTSRPTTLGPSPDTVRTVRAFELHAAAPELDSDQVQPLLEQSDRWSRALQADSPGGAPVDVGATIATAFDDAEPTKAQARAWHDAHQDLFDGRGYRASAFTVDRLIGIERVRAALEQRAGGG